MQILADRFGTEREDVHDRVPVISPNDVCDVWLAPGFQKPAVLPGGG